MDGKVLNSWKEIAEYLGRGRRTVQRWERELRLPVHRPKGKSRSAVIALPRELDAWLARAPLGPDGATKRVCSTLHLNAEEMMRRAEAVHKNAQRLQEHMTRTMQHARKLNLLGSHRRAESAKVA